MARLVAALTFPLGGDPVAAGSRAAKVRDALGLDVFFSDDFKMSAAGDYETIEGLPNLRQSIRHRLMTRPGEYALYGYEYGAGVVDFVAKQFTKAVKDELRNRVLAQLAKEPRIEEVYSVEIEKTEVYSVPIVVLRIKVRALGQEVQLQPFQFAAGA
jgi:phage baseplate assembly protein W